MRPLQVGYCFFLLLSIYSCASKKKVGLHFQNIAYTQYSRHEDLNMDVEKDAYKDSVRQEIVKEFETPKVESEVPDIDIETEAVNDQSEKAVVPFAYEDVVSTEEVRISGDESSHEYQERKKAKHERLKRSNNRKSKSKIGIFSLLSFLTSFAAVLAAVSVAGVGSFFLGVALASFGLVTGIIGFIRAKSTREGKQSRRLAQVGFLINGLLLLLAVLALISAPSVAGLFGGL